MISYKSTKLSTKFPAKDKIVYHSKCPSDGCHENYIVKTNRPIVEKIQDHNIRDKSSHLLNMPARKVTPTFGRKISRN